VKFLVQTILTLRLKLLVKQKFSFSRRWLGKRPSVKKLLAARRSLLRLKGGKRKPSVLLKSKGRLSLKDSRQLKGLPRNVLVKT
jgi:hypothetical protein